MYVVASLWSVVLGIEASERLGVVKFVDDVAPSGVWERRYPQQFQGLGTLSGEYTIRLKPNSMPYGVHVARRVPLPMREAVKHELDDMERQGVIRKVEGPSEWCAGMVPVWKPSGAVRISVDLTDLNRNVLRERYALPTVDETLGLLSGATVFSKLDANSGFYQIKLASESQLLTTFITPYRRYCFQRLPFGITSAPEYFQKRMSEILNGMPGVVNLIDDILILVARKQNMTSVCRKHCKGGKRKV